MLREKPRKSHQAPKTDALDRIQQCGSRDQSFAVLTHAEHALSDRRRSGNRLIHPLLRKIGPQRVVRMVDHVFVHQALSYGRGMTIPAISSSGVVPASFGHHRDRVGTATPVTLNQPHPSAWRGSMWRWLIRILVGSDLPLRQMSSQETLDSRRSGVGV